MTEQKLVFETMGTIVSYVHAGEPENVQISNTIRFIFDRYDTKYSLYKTDSELSQIASNRIGLIDASDELKDMYALALAWRNSTHGVFTPHRPDGTIDLSGVVKAAAIDEVGTYLKNGNITNWCLNVGGDILADGVTETGKAWTVGIVDPSKRSELITSVILTGSRKACATSELTERGEHIWTSQATPTTYIQATVVADDIVTADVLATTVVAGNSNVLEQICASWDVDIMAIDHNGNVRMTPRFLS